MSNDHTVATRIGTSQLLKTMESETVQIRTARVADEQMPLHVIATQRGYRDGVRAVQYVLETLDPTNAEQIKELQKGLLDYLIPNRK
ncbi:MAG TPA: hypothetical protein VJH92_00565 [Candidatus Nanoarchaeia archaeon]|nr:hypothetical protein [Candidatus Nanoarchaeia archaeon]